jgi:phosphoglycolate phosphatase-like HAD superfamily hydrolase
MVHILGAEDGFKAKPSSEMFDAFIERSGALRENTIYVGDAPVDIEAAINAGIDAYVIANPIFSSEELALHSPRRILKDINELSAAVTPIV